MAVIDADVPANAAASTRDILATLVNFDTTS